MQRDLGNGVTSGAAVEPVVRGPQVTSESVRFVVPDDEHVLRGVRLDPALSTTSTLDFRATRSGWSLDFARPPVRRMEYKLNLAHRDGRSEDVVDPGNPGRTPGAFGDKSVIEFPDYTAPAWLTHPEGGEVAALSVATRGLGGPVEVAVWSPPGADPVTALPLLVAHDGPEYERMAALTRYAGALVASGQVEPFRVALLAPGSRNEWYSAKNAYARALVLAVLPAVREAVAVRRPVVGMGASLGALAMMHVHRLYPNAFGGLFLQSGSFFDSRLDPQERDFARFTRLSRFVLATRRPAPDAQPIPVVLTCGTAEENLANNRQFTGALLAQGYPARLVEVPDAHNFVAWRDAFEPSLRELLTAVWSTGD